MKSLFYIRIYLLGVLVHLIYLTALNFYTPIIELNWAHADTSTYTEPARSFLEQGKFLSGGEPDYRRTFGYPAFVALAMWISVSTSIDWRMITYLLQAIVFAVAYPAIAYLGISLFSLSARISIVAIVLLICAGAFISYLTAVLSDGLFATLFVCSASFGVAAMHMRRRCWLILHVALMAAAASVRPILALYPISMLLFWGRRTVPESSKLSRGTQTRLLAMVIVSLISTQIPAIRNWINHRVYTSSEIGSINLYDYLAREILYYNGKDEQYPVTAQKINIDTSSQGLRQRIESRKSEAFQVYSTYPISTLAIMGYNGLLNMVEFHWNNTLFFLFKINWYKDYEDGSVRWSPVPYIIGIIFVMYYGIIYLAAIIWMIISLRKPEHILATLLFIAPLLLLTTSYQGARFRLWFEPFVVLSALAAIKHLWERLREDAPAS